MVPLKRPIALVVLVLLATFALRTSSAYARTAINHDEAISYLAVSCNQAAYSQVGFSAEPVPAATWKSYLQIRQPFCYDEIGRGLAETDIHPPLYFWLLHTWVLITGVQFWAGPLLNSFVSVMVVAILYRFAARHLRSRPGALLVAATYGLSIAAILAANMARQYELLALLSLALITLMFEFVQHNHRQVWPYITAITVATAAGALTHFLFLLPASAVLAFSAWRLFRSDRRRLSMIYGALVAGYLMALILFPLIATAQRRPPSSLSDLDLNEFSDRVVRVIVEFKYFYYVFLMAGILLVPRYFQQLRSRNPVFGGAIKVDPSPKGVLFFLVWILGSIVLLYVLTVSPRHAMGPRYLSMVWPLLAFLPYFILRMVNFRRSIVLYFYLLPIILAVALLGANYLRAKGGSPVQWNDADLVVIDNPARGMLSQMIWSLPEDKEVVVGHQDFLIANQASWIQFFTEHSLYMSRLGYSSTEKGREDILSLLEKEGLGVVSPKKPWPDRGTVLFRFCPVDQDRCDLLKPETRD